MPQLVDIPTQWVGRRFNEFATLTEGKALFYPWSELDDYADGIHTLRNAAGTWSKRLGVKLKVRKGAAGMYVYIDQNYSNGSGTHPAPRV